MVSPVDLPIFLIATFLGALVAGLSGFAFGLLRGWPRDQQRAVFS